MSARPHRGMVLVIVLWVLTLLAVMAGNFAHSVRIATRLTTHALERAKARALAEAGVTYAIAWQHDPAAQKEWPANGDVHDWAFGGGRLQITVTNSSGLINLNTASADLLKTSAQSAGVAGSPEWIAGILAWRGQGNNAARTVQGGVFHSVEELQQIPGVTQTLYDQLVDGVTVYGQHQGINPVYAPAAVLRALGLDERAIDDYVSKRGTEGAPLTVTSGFFSLERSTVYHITVMAETDAGARATVRAVVDLQSPGQPVRWLSWRE